MMIHSKPEMMPVLYIFRHSVAVSGLTLPPPDPSPLLAKNTTKPLVLSLLQCGYCKIMFTNLQNAHAHLTQAHPEVHKCTWCDFKFRTEALLDAHIEKEHSVVVVVETDVGTKLDATEEMNVSESAKENTEIHVKTSVKKNTKSKMNVGDSAKKEASSKQLKINVAVSASEKAVSKKKRIRRKTNCPLCKRTLDVGSMKAHMRVHTGERPYRCKQCGRGFTCRAKLKCHLGRHSKAWRFICNYCGRGYVEKYLLVYHIRRHTNERRFPCSKCDKRFWTSTALNSHLETHNTDYSFTCEECGQQFKTLACLLGHRRSHIPIEQRRKFKCQLCDSRFQHRKLMENHVRSKHTGETPFACDICDKKYSSENGLKYHMTLHRGLKPFTCNLCNKSFAFKEYLVVHSRMHTGEKPFECDVCHTAFRLRSALISHTRKNHGSCSLEEKPENQKST